MINFLSDIVAGEGIQVDANERFLSRTGLELLRPNTQSELIYMLSQLAEHVRDYTRLMRHSSTPQPFGETCAIAPMII